MSRATVRAGIAAWMSTPQVTGINTVYSAQPRIVPETAFYAGTYGATSGAVCFIHISEENEQRTAMGGAHAGWKRIDYTVDLQLLFRYIGVASVNGDSGLDAMGAFDTIVENLKTRIRDDRTAGGAVWQWGEADLIGRFGELTEVENGLELWGVITTQVTEWITA